MTNTNTPTVGNRVTLRVRWTVDEIQTLASTATKGVYRLRGHEDQTTDPIPWDANHMDVEEALNEIIPGGVVCAGGPHPGQPITVQFTGGLGKRPRDPLVAITTDLDGTIVVDTLQQGGPILLDAAPVITVTGPGLPEEGVTPAVTDLGGGAYRAAFTPEVEGDYEWTAVGASTDHGPMRQEATFTVT